MIILLNMVKASVNSGKIRYHEFDSSINYMNSFTSTNELAPSGVNSVGDQARSLSFKMTYFISQLMTILFNITPTFLWLTVRLGNFPHIIYLHAIFAL